MILRMSSIKKIVLHTSSTVVVAFFARFEAVAPFTRRPRFAAVKMIVIVMNRPNFREWVILCKGE
jgi:hypothetical protein